MGTWQQGMRYHGDKTPTFQKKEEFATAKFLRWCRDEVLSKKQTSTSTSLSNYGQFADVRVYTGLACLGSNRGPCSAQEKTTSTRKSRSANRLSKIPPLKQNISAKLVQPSSRRRSDLRTTYCGMYAFPSTVPFLPAILGVKTFWHTQFC